MEHCGIGGFTSATEIAGMAGFMTAVSLLIVAGALAALWLGGKSLYEVSMGKLGDPLYRIWLPVSVIALLGAVSVGLMTIPPALCLWGAV